MTKQGRTAQEFAKEILARRETEMNSASEAYNKASRLGSSMNNLREMTDDEIRKNNRQYWDHCQYGYILSEEEILKKDKIEMAHIRVRDFISFQNEKEYWECDRIKSSRFKSDAKKLAAQRRYDENIEKRRIACYTLESALSMGVNNRSLTEGEYNFITESNPQRILERYRE